MKVYKDNSETFTGKLFDTHSAAALHYMGLLIEYGVEEGHGSIGRLIPGIRVDMPELIAI